MLHILCTYHNIFQAALFTVGFHEHESTNNDMKQYPFKVTLVDKGPLTKINKMATSFDMKLSHVIKQQHHQWFDNKDKINAMVSISSEPTTIHAASLGVCSRLNLPVVGSGGTSLSKISSKFDLRVVGNSGGSVGSTTITKAKGFARSLADEWSLNYDGSSSSSIEETVPSGDRQSNVKECLTTTPLPTLKSILEAALPTFLFVCITLRLTNNTWDGGEQSTTTTCTWQEDQEGGQNDNTPISIVKYALEHLVLGTTCCVLAASSLANGGDQSTLLQSATIAGVLTSASASQSVYHTTLSVPSNVGGGSALAGLIGGAFIPSVMKKVCNLCHRFNITATMTNILCGGGVGMLVGVMMYISGLAHGLGLLTGVIRCLIRWKKVMLSPTNGGGIPISLSSLPLVLPHIILHSMYPILHYMQELWCHFATIHPSMSMMFYNESMHLAQGTDCKTVIQSLPIPIGFGFIYGMIFVFGSKIGWYHSIFLPLILLEVDAAAKCEEASLLGAIDECTLVLICAGICAGNIILPPPPPTKENTTKTQSRSGGHALLSWRALKTNLFCGDFIEAAYPSMEQSWIINASAYVAAGISTEILLHQRVLSSAYLPLPVAIWISNDRLKMSIACLVAFSISLSGTIASNFRR